MYIYKSVLGEGFSPEIISQINIRQEKLSVGSHDYETLQYANSKGTFINLYSSCEVDPSSSFISDFPQDIRKNVDSLAKKYPLKIHQKYTNSNTNQQQTVSGVSYKQSQIPAYGWLATKESGLTPPPGIISAEVKTLNRGSLREATLKITCHNQTQFQIIDALYLRLGFTMLLEWGHTLFFNNSGTITDDIGPDSDLRKLFFDTSTPYYELSFKINELSVTTYEGNYDAFLGQVDNFDWVLRRDGGYDITLRLISIGSMVESFKINTRFPGLKSGASYTTNQVDPSTNNSIPPVISYKNKSTLHQILFGFRQALNSNGASVIFSNDAQGNYKYINGYKVASDYALTTSWINSYVKNYSEYDIDVNYSNFFENGGRENSENDVLAQHELISLDFKNLATTATQDGDLLTGTLYYIKLGALLRVIQNYLLMYDNTKNAIEGDSSVGLAPIFFLDHYYSTNYCLTFKSHFSLDPNVCYLPQDMGNIQTGDGYFWLTPPSFRCSDEYQYLGRFMHIHVNLDYIASLLNNLIDKEGKVSLYDFLTQLMKGIQKATGNVNNFEVTYDESSNTLSIIDNSILPGILDKMEAGFVYDIDIDPIIKYKKTYSTSTAEFNTHLLTNSYGSFIKDVQLSSEINNNFISDVTMGAQANGNIVGNNSVTLSKLNSSYVDRIIHKKSSRSDDDLASGGTNWTYTSARINSEADYINKGVVTYEQINEINYEAIDFFNFFLGIITEKDNIFKGKGLIPLNLKLTMDGLSGMRIGQTYTINERILPHSYKGNIQFLIKGISHTINEDGWLTMIESISGPKPTPPAVIEETGGEYNDLENFIQEEPNLDYLAALNDLPQEFQTQTPDPIPKYFDISNLSLFIYLSWQQGSTGAAEHFSLYRDNGKKQLYKTVTGAAIGKNWPGSKVSRGGVTKAEAVRLYQQNTHESHVLVARAFVDVWRQQYYDKTRGNLGWTAFLAKPGYKNRTGMLFTDISNIFKTAALNDNFITYDALADFAFIENGWNTDTDPSSLYQTMFQMNKTFPEYQPAINTQSTRVVGGSGQNAGFTDYYPLDKLVPEVIKAIKVGFNLFIKYSGFVISEENKPITNPWEGYGAKPRERISFLDEQGNPIGEEPEMLEEASPPPVNYLLKPPIFLNTDEVFDEYYNVLDEDIRAINYGVIPDLPPAENLGSIPNDPFFDYYRNILNR